MPVNTERKSFWLMLLTLGGLMAIGFFTAFLYAAPTIPRDEQHNNHMAADVCLSCHLVGNQTTPIIPHVSMPGCVFCHGQ